MCPVKGPISHVQRERESQASQQPVTAVESISVRKYTRASFFIYTMLQGEIHHELLLCVILPQFHVLACDRNKNKFHVVMAAGHIQASEYKLRSISLSCFLGCEWRERKGAFLIKAMSIQIDRSARPAL